MSESNPTGAGQLESATKGIARDRLWSEMADSQKLDALRREVRSLHYTIRELRKLEVIARGHIHAPNGGVFVPANDERNEAYGYSHEILK